jgi:tricorn protease
MKKLLLFCLVFFTFIASVLALNQGYYRYPAIRGDAVYFTAEGDLWTVGLQGGPARRITTHLGEETDVAVSRTGDLIAFTASYEGPPEVYTMPVTGGLPKRWTFDPGPSIAIGFTPDNRLVYATREYSTLPNFQLVTIDITTGDRDLIPLSQASDGAFDPSGKKLFFVRPDYHRNNTKRYQGGTARNIWKFSEGDLEATNLTSEFPGENHSPMWWKDRVYFVCDRDGTMNIWSMDENGADLRQHTRHSGWDVKDPSIGDGRIVYQLGADIWLFEIESQTSGIVPITLISDFDQLREKWVQDPMDYLTSVHISHEGDRIALTSRGRLFVAPVKSGRLVKASQKEGIRFRDAVFMPDGKNLITLTDESGEFEFTLVPANGVGPDQPITSDGKILRFRGYPSPDGEWIAYSDMNEDLWILSVDSGQQVKINRDREGVGDVCWAPDSGWIAYVKTSVNTFNQIYLYNLETQQHLPLTTDRMNSFSPAWSTDGQFIYFLSDRNLRSVVGSPWGPRQPEPYFDRPINIYVLPLQSKNRSPFRPDDELVEPQKGTTGSMDEPDQSVPDIRVDAEGIMARLKTVPVDAGNYSGLEVNKEGLFWLSREDESSRLMGIKIGNEKPKTVKILEGIRSFELSGNGERVLVRKGNDLFVIPAKIAENKLEESKIDLGQWNFSMSTREDFRQLFIDAWRMERDYFYDPGMHGVDWNAMRDKYLPLVDRVTNRLELSDLIGQLVGELSALHVSVRGGDLREGTDQVKVPSLGARLVRDPENSGYRVDYIYQSDPDFPEELSPLSDPDAGILPGDYIESINGMDILSVIHPNALLRNQQGRQVLLGVRTPGQELRQVIVIPIDDESNLRYRDWEYTRRMQVEEKGNGELGYVHLKAMGSGNITEWYRNFYPVFNRKGLIVDVRHNRGGNIDSLILEKLLRKAWFYWKPRVGSPYWNMQYAFRGHMVVLCNEMTASDGEAFAEGFRRLGLGMVIGTRTWGGEIWLSSNNRLTDGGLARAPQTGVYGPEGIWLIEGHGVLPDIVVDNLPHETFNGRDAQLEAAIEFLKEQIETIPVDVPKAPPYPDKSFAYPQ